MTAFKKIVWVTLGMHLLGPHVDLHLRLFFAFTRQLTCELVLCTGQTPNIDHLQRIVYEQLVPNAGWDSDAPEDIKRQRLDEAYRGQDILLVLDDLCECGQPCIAYVPLH
eukprot:COSAG02_NODE_945_length_15722_cov_74.792357_9_plen_110_part_00